MPIYATPEWRALVYKYHDSREYHQGETPLWRPHRSYFFFYCAATYRWPTLQPGFFDSKTIHFDQHP